jgi:hypothetical protein
MRYPESTSHRRVQAGLRSAHDVHGGIVIIDQSGSMDLDESALSMHCCDVLPTPSSLATATDRATTGDPQRVDLGRSRIGRDDDSLGQRRQRRGRRGPRVGRCSPSRNTEPIIWVTDGQVTDSHDHPDETLTSSAPLVLRHRIRLVKRDGWRGRALSLGRTTSRHSGANLAELDENSRKCKAF